MEKKKLFPAEFKKGYRHCDPNGELLTFKGGGAEMAIFESELEFYVKRKADFLKLRRIMKNNINKIKIIVTFSLHL